MRITNIGLNYKNSFYDVNRYKMNNKILSKSQIEIFILKGTGCINVILYVTKMGITKFELGQLGYKKCYYSYKINNKLLWKSIFILVLDLNLKLFLKFYQKISMKILMSNKTGNFVLLFF